MLANALCESVAGWKFQLCADVTGNFCSRSVDHLKFSVTSIPCKYKVLKVPVDTAMCENFQGFGNFCRVKFDMDPILCKPQATGR
jgi:hypothetical protein